MDDVPFLRKIDAAIRQLQPELLATVRGRSDRYSICPAITAVVTAERIAALAARYTALACGETPAGEGDEEIAT